MYHWFQERKDTEDAKYYERPNTLYVSPLEGLTLAQIQLILDVLSDETRWKGKQLFEMENGHRDGWI
jgi:hypothetical protein